MIEPRHWVGQGVTCGKWYRCKFSGWRGYDTAHVVVICGVVGRRAIHSSLATRNAFLPLVGEALLHHCMASPGVETLHPEGAMSNAE